MVRSRSDRFRPGDVVECIEPSLTDTILIHKGQFYTVENYVEGSDGSAIVDLVDNGKFWNADRFKLHRRPHFSAGQMVQCIDDHGTGATPVLTQGRIYTVERFEMFDDGSADVYVTGSTIGWFASRFEALPDLHPGEDKVKNAIESLKQIHKDMG